MEVDGVQVSALVNSFENQADEQSLSPEVADAYNVFGDPDIFPRVGEQYQVEIPPLILESDHCSQKNPCDRESTAGNPHDYLVGLPIPIIWIRAEEESNKREPPEDACEFTGVTNKVEFSKLECIKKSQKGLEYDEPPTPEATDSTLIKTRKLGKYENSSVQQVTKIEMHEKLKGRGNCLVPGSSSDSWNEIEEASFILGLYIFGKNLVQVKKFIGNKSMGDILSFYYGEFYKTDRYQRWSECRKVRSRKCISGQKIFTGARQQELLSRLIPNVSEECRNNLLKVSKTFAEGKMLLEDYVLSLKASVGLSALIEAVGVGKGKGDLTGLNVDPLKSTHALPVRPEIPFGKACSMLSPEEIITFLTGDFRLSKARSSDLFWEAVWPRLLARGWHSEQPGNKNYAVASKHSLVFLVPGVKKFSRKLVRGNHYFDSVSDILGKVASDPELIELETAADNDCRGNGWTKETNLDRESSPDQQRHCYLKPRTPNRSTDVTKVTVVDTTLTVEKTTKVRELRSLPLEVLEASSCENDSDNEKTSEEQKQTNESDSVNIMCSFRKKIDFTGATKFNIGKIVSSDINGFQNNPSREEPPMRGTGSTNLSASFKDQKTDLLNTQRRKAMKRQSSWKVAPDKKSVIIPDTKRQRRLTACSRAERSYNSANIFVGPRIKPEEASWHFDNSKSSDNVSSQENPAQENKLLADLPPQENKKLADSLSNSTLTISREAVPASSSSTTEEQCKKSRPRTMIDLNLPVLPESEGDEPSVLEMTERQQNNAGKELYDPSAGTISQPVDNSEHQPEMNTRRHSTRNRPLTTKVLEAFAFGYLDRKEKRKSRDYPSDSSISRSPRRARDKATCEFTSSNGPNFQKEERANGVW